MCGSPWQRQWCRQRPKAERLADRQVSELLLGETPSVGNVPYFPTSLWLSHLSLFSSYIHARAGQGSNSHGALRVEGRHVEQVQENFNNDQDDHDPFLIQLAARCRLRKGLERTKPLKGD